MLKKIISLSLILCVLFSVLCSALAADKEPSFKIDTEDRNEIIKVLRFVECDKGDFDIENVDFEKIEIGEKVYTYEYTEDGFKRSGALYLIFADGHVIGTAFESEPHLFSFSTSLAKLIDKTGCNEIALVYDYDGCYLFDGKGFIFLMSSSIKVEGRARLDTSKAGFSSSGLETKSMNNKMKLGYSRDEQQTRSYVSCSISYVTQNPYQHLCWAATVAMIVNSLTNLSLTPAGIAQAFWHDYNYFDCAANDTDVADFIEDNYNIGYTYDSYPPSEDAICSNILNSYPIYGSFTWVSSINQTTGRHAGAIYAIDDSVGYISLMDPEIGSMAASYNGSSYVYVRTDTNVILTLDRGICYYW